MCSMTKCILGTAQLGMPYGIANTQGQPDLDIAKKIIKRAIDNNILCFDTAQVYGVSEQVLGMALQALQVQPKVKIITKVSSENLQDEYVLSKAFNTSLRNIGISSLYCFMLHHEEYLPLLDAWQGDFLRKLQEQGKISHLGISVYAPERALEALEHPLIQIVQVPSSLFDKRFMNAGVFERAKELKKEVHVRSIFLQGVLCMPVEKLPVYLEPLSKYVKEFQNICQKAGCTPSQAALAWMQYIAPEAFLIFGAESSTQVQENMDILWQECIDMQELYARLDTINVPQLPELLNPSYWNK